MYFPKNVTLEDDRASREVFVTEHIFPKYNILDPHGGVPSSYSVINRIAIGGYQAFGRADCRLRSPDNRNRKRMEILKY
jgi:hypothetical protein